MVAVFLNRLMLLGGCGGLNLVLVFLFFALDGGFFGLKRRGFRFLGLLTPQPCLRSSTMEVSSYFEFGFCGFSCFGFVVVVDRVCFGGFDLG